MNDTILNPRQKSILEIIEKNNGISRQAIIEALPQVFKSSVPTIARDLSFLLQNKLVTVSGKGPSTNYLPLQDNPLLKFVDLDSYFLLEIENTQRADKSFNNKVFDHLTNLFSYDEMESIKRKNKSFENEIKNLNRDIYLKELERFIIELSWKSSKIEGNTYSLLDTETLIKQKTEAVGHSKDEATMILNHKVAFETILENKGDFKSLKLSQVLQLHNILVKGLSITTGIRSHKVGITGTSYTPLDNKWQIQEALEELIKTINKSGYPLEKALITIALLSYIQPFSDGNKRTARMLANAVLLANNFYPLSYRSVDETYYKKALVIFYEQNSLHHLKDIVIDQYNFALNTYFR